MLVRAMRVWRWGRRRHVEEGERKVEGLLYWRYGLLVMELQGEESNALL